MAIIAGMAYCIKSFPIFSVPNAREYTGCLVNFKTTTQSYKNSKIIYNSEDKQAVFENHHEIIIDRDRG